jgi:hypothetical protein
MARKYKPRKKKPMSEAKKRRLLHFVEHHMSKKDKGRNKKAAMVKYCGVVKKLKGL